MRENDRYRPIPVDRRIFGAPVQRAATVVTKVLQHEEQIVLNDAQKLWAKLPNTIQRAGHMVQDFDRKAHLIIVRQWRRLPRPVKSAGHYIRKHYLEYPLLALVIFSALVPVLNIGVEHAQADSYSLAKASGILSSTPQNVSKNISYDSKLAAYTYTAPIDEQAQQNSQAIGGTHYDATLNENAASGISMTDVTNKLSIKLTPQFSTMTAKKVNDHIVYPISGNDGQLVYTFKGNGLKEDIVLYGADADEASFSYKLSLAAGLEARIQSDGSIGIFGGDSALYGNVSTGSPQDKALLDKARAKSAKNALMYVIPAPTITTGNGKAERVKAAFELHSGTLTIHVSGLTTATFPLSIDPTLALASTSDWAKGSGDNIDFTSANQISRATLTGGDASSTTLTAPGYSAEFACSVIWNGYIYLIGGQNPVGTPNNKVSYAPLNPSTGAPGSWTTQTISNLLVPSRSATVVNGRIYLIDNSTGSAYLPINSDGSVGSLVSVTAPPLINGSSYSLIGSETVTSYNNYIYFAKYDASVTKDDTFYVAVNPDGTLGTWTQTVTLPIAADNNALEAYNGYMYFSGGGTGSPHTAWSNNTYYTKINSDGSLATCNGTTWCTASNNFTGAREGMGVTIANGYIYVNGGCANSASGGTAYCYNSSSGSGATTTVEFGDMQYAPVYANGDIGPWRTGTSTRTAFNFTLLSANKTLYFGLGGYEGISNCPGLTCTNTPSYIGTADYATISGAGMTTAYTTSASTFTARGWGGAVYASGYIYVIGGCSVEQDTPTCTGTALTTVEAAAVNSDGTLGTFSTKTSLPIGLWNFGITASSNHIYIAGGCTNAAGVCAEQSNLIVGTISDTAGTISWATDSTHVLSTNRRYLSLTVCNGYLYAIGGYHTNTEVNVAEFAQLASDGTISSTFQANSTALPQNRAGLSATTQGSYIYVIGGGSLTQYRGSVASNGQITWSTFTTAVNAGNTVSSVIYNGYIYSSRAGNVDTMPLNADGSVGTPFSNTAVPVNRYSLGDIAVNGRLYIVGGCSASTGDGCGSIYNNVIVAQINNGGSGQAQAWTSSSQTISARRNLQVLYTNGYLYAIAGCSTFSAGACTSVSSATQYAAVSANGDVGAWQTATNTIPTTLQRFSAWTWNGFLYVAGGCSNTLCNTKTTTVYYVKPAPSGNITSAWTSQANGIPQVTVETSITAYNGYAYRIGGNVNACASSCGTTEYAPLNSDGSVGSWTAGTTMGTGVFANTAVAYNGYVYSVGGYDGTNALTAVQFAPINSDHSLGTWSYTSNMIAARQSEPAVGISNGYMYVVGGFNSSNLSETEVAPILSNGLLGLWTVGPSLGAATSCLSGVVTNGTMYAIGGTDSTGPTGTVYYSRLGSIARSAAYSKILTTDKDVTPANSLLRYTSNNAALNIRIQTSSLAANSFGSVASFANTNNIPTSLSSLSQASTYAVTINIDDSQNATFPDFASGATTITYFKLNYHPNTSMRLRGGGTFNGGVNQSLDAP